MEPYIQEHAALYDIFYQDKDYASETAFVDHLLKQHGKNVNSILEIACGTGNHSFLLEAKGYELFSTDISAGMIGVAKNKKEQKGSSIHFEVQDMRTLPRLEKKYGAALCLFDSLGYAITNEGIINTLKGIGGNLQQDGVLIFECWHAGAMLKNFDPLRVKKMETENASIIRISETSLNYEEQTATVSYTIHQHFKDNTYSTISEQLTCRFFLLQEIKLLLQAAGFNLLTALNGYQDDPTIDENCWHILCVAKKNN